MVALKREKMACQISMTRKKERERKKMKGGNHVSKKKRDRDDSRERTNALKE